ncbi:hypothetical protein Pen01_05210 [Phytomonospora endophytica]|nr:hypothetical protein Pen01_05210 [Phytomonospora endophytica]
MIDATIRAARTAYLPALTDVKAVWRSGGLAVWRSGGLAAPADHDAGVPGPHLRRHATRALPSEVDGSDTGVAGIGPVRSSTRARGT